MKRTALWLLLPAVLILPGASTILIKKNLAELSQEARAVVLAEVISSTPGWNAERTLIWTTTELRIIDSWKGTLSGSVKVMEPGGILPGVGHLVEGMARYAAGEKVVVFLTIDVLGQWRTLGCCQGAFRVVASEDGRERPEVPAWQKHVVEGWFARLESGQIEVPAIADFKAKVVALAAAKPEGR